MDGAGDARKNEKDIQGLSEVQLSWAGLYGIDNLRIEE